MTDPRPAVATTPVVDVRGLSAGYDGRRVLHDVDIEVAGGEVVALLGANGSGKSTLVKALVGIVPTADGKVRLFGDPVTRFRDWSRVGYVPQRVTAAAGVPATVREVVRSGRAARRPWWRPESARDREVVDDALEQVGVLELQTRSVAALSGGQQQRVLIARALATEPDLLVLDEANAGIDLPSQEVLAELLTTVSARGTSVVLVAHELGPLRPVIDRAVVLRHGRVAMQGPIDDVVAAAVDSDHVHAHADAAPTGLWGLS